MVKSSALYREGCRLGRTSCVSVWSVVFLLFLLLLQYGRIRSSLFLNLLPIFSHFFFKFFLKELFLRGIGIASGKLVAEQSRGQTSMMRGGTHRGKHFTNPTLFNVAALLSKIYFCLKRKLCLWFLDPFSSLDFVRCVCVCVCIG